MSSIAASPNQSASQPSPQSRVSQAKSEEAREIEAFEQKRQAEIKIEKERQAQRALKQEQDKRLEAQMHLENRQRWDQQMQERAEEGKRKRELEQASQEKALKDKEIAQKESMERTVAGFQRGFYQNMINDICEISWSNLKKSKEYVSQQAVRKSSSRELCACTKENLPKAPFTKNFPFERIETSMKKGKYVDMSFENQQLYDLMVNVIAGSYEGCAVSFAQKGN
jgi:hypothetical protein